MAATIAPSLTVDIFFDRAAVQRAVDQANLRYLRRAGSVVRLKSRSSIKRKGHARRRPKPGTKAFARWLQEVKDRPTSPPGHPPYTHTGLFKRAIVYGFDFAADAVVVGFLGRLVDDVAAVHEHGGTREGQTYPARPTMRPALDDVIPKLPQYWADSLRA